MNLFSVTIKNFRSIKDATFTIEEVDGSNTFTLVGINESGKSSFLNAISLIDSNDEEIVFPKDYFDDNEPINITLKYQLETEEEEKLNSLLIEKGFEKHILSQIKVKEINVCATFDPAVDVSKKVFDQILFEKNTFEEYTLQEHHPVKKDLFETQEDFDLEKYFEVYLPEYFCKISHQIVFWKSDSKHLINDQIDLNAFSAKPEDVSIPLMNCFELAGVNQKDIVKQIIKLTDDPSEIKNLADKLGDTVTAHIKKVWPDHPVKIAFLINNLQLSFLVKDEKVKYSAKTTGQRSDGFRQFISFLLTISAKSAINMLSNSLLLLDEPETHLHPQAQLYLKDELIKITKNDKNNIVFFATHSNYMIDKDHIERCFKVSKPDNEETKLEKIPLCKTSYSEVNYEVFNIPSSDYHNELYGYLLGEKEELGEKGEKSKLDNLPKEKKWKNEKSGKIEDVSLPKYIRNTIHHPENASNAEFTEDELKRSIEKMRELKKLLK